MSKSSMAGKTCLVTGGNSGIGRETAIDLARMGATVAIVSRDRGRGETALADIKAKSGSSLVSLMVADFSSQKAIRELAAEVKAKLPRLDVLVNNAGAIHGERTLTVDGIESTFAVNHLGYFLLTRLLLDLLEASAPARVVSVASDAHRSGHINFDDLGGEHGYSGWNAYAQSKLANILFTHELAKRVDPARVTANCLHPGVVATNFAGKGPALIRFFFALAKPFLINSSKGARTSVYLASSPEVASTTGKYFDKCRAVRSSAESCDDAIASRLWSVSESMTGSV